MVGQPRTRGHGCCSCWAPAAVLSLLLATHVSCYPHARPASAAAKVATLLAPPSIVELALDHRDDYMGYVNRSLPSATGFKRELLVTLRDMYIHLALQRRPVLLGTATIHPLSFSIPEELVLRTPPSKSTAVCLPYWAMPKEGKAEATREEDGEAAYYKTMSIAYFALTVKKAGWDCLRHLEILAAGSVPLFTDLADAPPNMLSSYPKSVLLAALSQPGLKVKGHNNHDTFDISLDRAQLDPELYTVLVSALLSYTRNVLTTDAMARHVLSILGGVPKGKKVLFITFPFDISHSHGDYMADTLLHGLKRELGQANVVDITPRQTQYKTAADLDLPTFLARRNALYGYGFTFSSRLYEAPGEVDRQNVAQRLADGEFGAVIYGQAHSNDILKLDLTKSVCQHMPPGKVAAIWAGDLPPPEGKVSALQDNGCVGVQFAREL